MIGQSQFGAWTPTHMFYTIIIKLLMFKKSILRFKIATTATILQRHQHSERAHWQVFLCWTPFVISFVFFIIVNYIIQQWLLKILTHPLGLGLSWVIFFFQFNSVPSILCFQPYLKLPGTSFVFHTISA